MLGVIIVNFNDWENLLRCIKSIDYIKAHRVYVIDNASKTHHLINEIRSHPNVKLTFNNENVGYSIGNNIGLDEALKDGCTSFIISNTDILFHKNTISELVNSLESQGVGIVGPRVILKNGLQQEEIFGVRISPKDKIKLILNSATRGLVYGKLRDLFCNKKQEKNKFFVYSLSGCCFAFNLRVASKIFPFDENIFLYNEEWIMGERCLNEGLVVMINSNIRVTHLHGETTKNIKLKSYLWFIESEQYVIKTLFPKEYLNRKIILLLRIPKLLYIYVKEKYNKI